MRWEAGVQERLEVLSVKLPRSRQESGERLTVVRCQIVHEGGRGYGRWVSVKRRSSTQHNQVACSPKELSGFVFCLFAFVCEDREAMFWK